MKYWFVLQNNHLIYYESSEELNPLGRIEIGEETLIQQFESSRHYGFEVIMNGETHHLSAITNGMRGIWMKALESAKNKCQHHHHHHQVQNESHSSLASPPMKSKKPRWRKKADLKIFDTLKDEFKEREKELENLRSATETIGNSLTNSGSSAADSPRIREVLKSQSVQIDSFRTQLSSGFLELEKLKVFIKNRENEFNESLKCKEESIEKLKFEVGQEKRIREAIEKERHELSTQIEILSDKLEMHKNLLNDSEREFDEGAISWKEHEDILRAQHLRLEQELDLLKSRCNDLTEKLYQSERTTKSLKTKLGRVKSQSLKEKQVEGDVLNKISDLEEKIKKFENKIYESISPIEGDVRAAHDSPVKSTESTGDGGGIINVIMKLNDLDQRVEKVVDSCWFRRGEVNQLVEGISEDCENCKLLESYLQEKEEQLIIMDGNLKQLEFEFTCKMKELREFVKDQPSNSETNVVTSTSPSTNKYQVEIEQLRVSTWFISSYIFLLHASCCIHKLTHFLYL